jgi:hypothetical protein
MFSDKSTNEAKSNIMLDYPIVKCIFQIMQNKINNQERGNMTKIRMNTELRNKLFNKIKNVFENEDTQEREAFLQAREDVDKHYVVAQPCKRSC